MNRKIAAIILGIGAFLIVILIGVLFYVSNSVKHNMQTSLNSYFTTFAETSDYIDSIEFEPFVCSGLKNFSCMSKNFKINDLFVFEDLALGIYDISKPNFLRITLESKNFNLVETKDIKDIKSLLNIFISAISPDTNFSELILPRSFSCDMKNSLENQIIQNLTTCKFNAQNMNYILEIDTKEDVNMKADNLEEMLFRIYQLYTTDLEAFKSQFTIALHSIALTLKPKNLKDSIINEAKLKNQNFNEKTYKNAIEISKNLATYTFGLTKPHKMPYHNEIIGSFDSVAKLLNEDVKALQYTILPKKENNFNSIKTIEARKIFNPKEFNLKSSVINE